MKRGYSIFAFLGLLAGLAVTAAAETAAPASDVELLFTELPITVASSKAATIFDTISTVSVIDQKKIQDYHFKTISEAVNTVPGFEVIRTQFLEQVSQSRGILATHYANKVLVLINGIPSWFSVTGEGFLDRVDIHDVDHIEVLKGPASVQYGSNAYSGVVNIVLKDGKKGQESGQVHGTVGDKNIFAGGGNYSNNTGDVSLFVAGNGSAEKGKNIKFTDMDGVSKFVDDNRYPVGGNFTFGAKWGEHSVLATGYKDTFMGLEGGDPKFSDGAGNPSFRNGYLADYTFAKNWDNQYELKYSLNYDWNEREFIRGTNNPNTQRGITNGSRTFSQLKGSANISDLNIELGADYEYRLGYEYLTYYPAGNTQLARAPYANIQDRHVYEYSGFGQLTYNYKPFSLVIGSRLTQNELFGQNLSSRGTLMYKLNDTNSLKLIAGQSYRAPSIFEQFVLTPSKSVVGNPNVLPETSDSIELAYLTSFSNLFAQINVYQANYRKKILRVPYAAGTFTYADGTTNGVPGNGFTANHYENGADFTARGVELELNYTDPNLVNAFLNGNFIANDGGYDQNFRYVPKYTAAAGVSKEIGNLFGSATANYLGAVNGRLDNIAASIVGDVSVGFKYGRSRHTITMQNVADASVFYPEYTKQSGNFLNQIPSQNSRRILYTFEVTF